MKIRRLIINNYFLIIVLLVASALRLYKLGTVPPHLTPDEASLGYNAYSILKTGRDEYGQLLPIIFKSFGDWKPGLYIYLTVPFVAIFGLNEWAVRLPSAITGVVVVWLLYKIVPLLFKTKKTQLRTTNYQLLALISAFLLAINPWHIHFSRGAWEVNVALTLTLAGIYFFLKAINSHSEFAPESIRGDPSTSPGVVSHLVSLRMTRVRLMTGRLFSKRINIIWSTFFFSLTLVTYQGAKMSTIIVVVLLILIYRNDLNRVLQASTRKVIVAVIVGVIIVLPVITSAFQGKTGRLEVFSIFSYKRPAEYVEKLVKQGNEERGSFSYYLFHSEGVNFARGVLGRWFNHFSSRFLFFEGDWQNLRHSAPNHGMLLLVDLILIPLGIFFFIRNRLSRGGLFVLLWLILAPLPAVLTRDQVQAVRAYNMLIPLILVSAYGATYFFGRLGKFGRLGLIGICALSLAFFLDAHFVHLSVHNAKHWYYGYEQVIQNIADIQNNHDTIVFQQSYDQPYIYYLFYTRYEPKKYQSFSYLTKGATEGDVGYVEHINNVWFTPINWSWIKSQEKILVIGDPVEIPQEHHLDGFRLVEEIIYPDGRTIFKIVEKI